jgi:O-antigen ligase
MLFATYGVFMCSYFIFHEYSEPYRVFARVVFPFGIFVFVAGIRDLWRNPLLLAVFAYLFYLLLSGFWSAPMDWFRLGQKLTISVYLVSFLTITYYLMCWNHALFERMLRVSILVAGIAALASILVFYQQYPFPGERLEAIGSLTNINSFSNVYGVFAILAMGFALRTPRRAHKALFIVAVALFISIAWFGQSRTALVAMTIALLTLMGLTLQQKRQKVLYTSIMAASIGALILLFPETLEQALLRGQGLRPLIWSEAWREAITAPIVGHGLISEVSIDLQGHHFETLHNAYLQVFWQGGMIGLCLFLLVLFLAFRTAWTQGRQQGDFTVFCILLFATGAMLTGVDTMIARPRDQWMLFWFPLALLLSYQGMAARSGSSLDATDARLSKDTIDDRSAP